MGKTKKSVASSSGPKSKKQKQAQKEVPDAPENIAHLYDAPFPLFNKIEGEIYKHMKPMKIISPRYIDWVFMDALGLKDQLLKYLKNIGLENYALLATPGYTPLCLEFFASVSITEKSDSFTCRLLGNEFSVTEKMMRDIFYLPYKGVRKMPKEFNIAAAWKKLSGFDNWSSDGMPSGFIKDPALAILHKFIAYNVFGNDQANKVNKDEVYLLDCAKMGRKVAVSAFILDHIHHIKRNARCRPTLCQISTGLAVHYDLIKVTAEPPLGHTMVNIRAIGESELRGVPFISKDLKILPFEQRNCVKRYLNERRAAQVHNTDDDDANEVEEDSSSQSQLLRLELKSFRDHFDTTMEKVFSRFDKQDKEIAEIQNQINTWNLKLGGGGPRPFQPPDQQ